MQERRSRAWATAAAAVGVAALLYVPVEPARAHEVAPGTRNPAADAAAAPVAPKASRNRWGANYFPNVALTTHDGKTVRLYDDLLKVKSVAMTVMYTDCGGRGRPCPTSSFLHAIQLSPEPAGRSFGRPIGGGFDVSAGGWRW